MQMCYVSAFCQTADTNTVIQSTPKTPEHVLVSTRMSSAALASTRQYPEVFVSTRMSSAALASTRQYPQVFVSTRMSSAAVASPR
jgi:hypothetical protein